MKYIFTYRTLLLTLNCLIYLPIISVAQNTNCDAKTLEEFFACYGSTNTFNPHSISAITTFIQAENAIKEGDYEQAKMLVENIFTTYPKGNTIWWNAAGTRNGANVGSPHAYYGLRMIEDIVDYHLNFNAEVQAKRAVMKVVVVGSSKGIQPTTQTELQNGTGPFITNYSHPKLKEDDYHIVKQSFDFFSQYVTAITKGQLEIDIEVVELPDLCMPVSVSRTRPYFATGSISPVWDALSNEVKESTDWWWILYPSHVPDFPAFDGESFITGGMGLDSKGGPAFISDDKWIVRKPAHLGKGEYSDIERRIYLPQWFQHEFFHHLYRAYPELGLEVNGHDWFDLNFWPSDFEGQFEPDYYAESLHKRLQPDCIPLAKKLITRISDERQAQFSRLSIDDLIGPYSLDNIQNPWHIGEIIKIGGRYFWRNSANVQWEVTPNITDGRLETGPDSPYPGQDFFIELYQFNDDTYIPGVTALKFQGEFYNRRFDLLRDTYPLEIVLDSYIRVPAGSDVYKGSIIKEGGKFYWLNRSGDRWFLEPNLDDEVFNLLGDSPTPGEQFELIVMDDECETHILGFKYLGDYYWSPKRDESNASPTLVNALPDLELQENFDHYSIDLSGMFTDPEGDSLLLFASSSERGLISTTVDGEQLQLSGEDMGNATIYVMALDPNGGLAVDEFKVEVGGAVSRDDLKKMDQEISIFPSPAQEAIHINGELSNLDISILSLDKSFQKRIPVSTNEVKIDLSDLSSGIYLIHISDRENGKMIVKKIIKL